MQHELIKFIQMRTATCHWCNGKVGMFQYIQESSCYRFIETSQNFYHYLIAERLWDDDNRCIVIKGFISFLIACWGQNESAIYSTYNERRRKEFFDIETKKPGSFKRDLEKEFAVQLLEMEQKNLGDFMESFDYITANEKALVLEYAHNYLEYTSVKYKQNLKTKSEISFVNLLNHDRKEALMKVLHELLDSRKGKDVVAVIKSMEKLYFLNSYNSGSNLHKLMTAEFGDIASVKNFNNYMNGVGGYNIQESEIIRITSILEKV